MVKGFFKARTIKIALVAFFSAAVTVGLEAWSLLSPEMEAWLAAAFGRDAFMALSILMIIMRVITTKPLSER